jgi:hypothetical protein
LAVDASAVDVSGVGVQPADASAVAASDTSAVAANDNDVGGCDRGAA